MEDKPLLCISDLDSSMQYKIASAKRVKTKYGNRIILELESHKLFLPAKFEELTDEDLDNINKSQNYRVQYEPPYNLKFSQTEDEDSKAIYIEDDDDDLEVVSRSQLTNLRNMY